MIGTSNMAKASSMLFGLKWCAHNGFRTALGETHSLLLAKCINREWKIPWRILNFIEEIQNLVEEHGFEINHSYRETNQPADRLANLGHTIAGTQVFNSFVELPKHIRGLINMDRWNLPSFRVKHTKYAQIAYEPP